MATAEAAPLPVADRMLPRPARVVDVVRETSDTVTLVLESLDGLTDERPWFEPGQFNMVYAFGVGEVPISIASDPFAPVVAHTIRSVGPVTAALCRLRRGDVVGLRGPFGRGWGVDGLDGRDVVVVAGGIGLAPLRAVVLRLLAEPARFGRCLLLLGARTPSDIPYLAEVATWRQRGLPVEVTVDYAEPGWDGHVGVVTTLIPRAPLRPDCVTALVCGPEVMMRFTASALRARGVAPEAIRLSLERNMKCGIGHCGHCQLGPMFVCHDGPVVGWPQASGLLDVRER